jgi:hypothetical protein
MNCPRYVHRKAVEAAGQISQDEWMGRVLAGDDKA